MHYIFFSFWFMVIHTVAYTVAGNLALKISTEIYEGKGRLMDYTRDMSDEEESKQVHRMFIPAQLLRGALMSLVLYPVMFQLGALAFPLRFAFLASLVFIYTHIACAAPCLDNIEGFVYLKDRYFSKTAFWKFQFEMIIYSLIFGLFSSWLFSIMFSLPG